MKSNIQMTRRTFVRRAAGFVSGAMLAPRFLRAADAGAAKPLFTAVGVTGSASRAAELKAAGAQYLVENTGNFLMPDKPEADFERSLAAVAESPLPIAGCNGFIRPAHLKCVGPEANPDAVLEWADAAFRRSKRAGVRYIVFGSAGARRLPEGWPVEKANAQFTEILKRMGPLARAQDVVVAVEPLQQRECNYLMRLGEVVAVVRAADHPNIRALADLYHMACMDEGPEAIASAAPFLYCVEIAEKEGRTAPGVGGQDFRPYFAALREAGYSGRITIEGRWDIPQLKQGFAEIRRQAAEVSE